MGVRSGKRGGRSPWGSEPDEEELEAGRAAAPWLAGSGLSGPF